MFGPTEAATALQVAGRSGDPAPHVHRPAWAGPMGQLCSRASLDEDIVPAFPLHGSPGNHTLIQTLCWPREESLSRCEEAQGSGGYETFALVLNAASSVAIGAAGLVSLLASDFSDEVGDLASAMTAMNGVGGLLALLTRLRVVEEVELQSMLIAALLFFKGMIRVLFPVINRSQYLRTVINLALVITMFTAACWTSFNLPPELYNRSHLSRRWATDLVVPLLWLAIATMSLLVYLTDHEFLDQVPHEEAPAAAPVMDGSGGGRRRGGTGGTEGAHVSTSALATHYRESSASSR